MIIDDDAVNTRGISSSALTHTSITTCVTIESADFVLNIIKQFYNNKILCLMLSLKYDVHSVCLVIPRAHMRSNILHISLLPRHANNIEHTHVKRKVRVVI